MKIRLLVLDVDGVLTDGGVYYSARGEELVRFNRRDGMGIGLLRKSGVEVAMTSGEPSEASRRRAEKLGLTEVHLGIDTKKKTLLEVVERLGISLEEVAYVGDDVNDLEAMELVGLSMAVGDALPRVRNMAKHVLRLHGGKGAVREAADHIMALNSEHI